MNRFYPFGPLAVAFFAAVAACAPEETTEDAVVGEDAFVFDGNQADRAKVVQSAQVWDEASFNALASKDLRNGVPANGMPESGGEIVCQFMPPNEKDEFGGKTSKFNCGPCTDPALLADIAAGRKQACTITKKTKIKNGANGHNASEVTAANKATVLGRFVQADARGGNAGEVASEIVGTRLLWSLGFYADQMYPARVLCYGCPPDPWPIYQGNQLDWAAKQGPGWVTKQAQWFGYAAAEIKAPGKKVEVTKDQGWDWNEYKAISEAAGGAPRAHVDALRLLAAFTQHGDNKPDNQRLICLETTDERETMVNGKPDTTAKCKAGAGRVMIQDIGAAFGSPGLFGIKKADLGAWRGQQIWENLGTCTAHLETSKPERTLKNPPVGDAGRQFLSEKMDKLAEDPARLRAIFETSGIAMLGDSVDAWIAEFNKKRAELRRPCGQ